MFPFNSSYLKRIRSVRPDRLVALWPQNEPLGHGISTEIIRGYHGAYTAVTLGQPGIQGSGLTSAGYDGATSYNDIYTAGFANDNGLLNPGFETPGAMPPTFLNWVDVVTDGAIDTEGVIVHEGADSCKITAGIGIATRIYQNFAVIPGQRRRFRIWSRGDGANAGRYRVYDSGAGTDIVPITSTGITAAAWGMVTVEYVVPPGCFTVGEFLYCPSVNGGIAYFDACEDRRTNGFLGDKGTIIVPAQVANAGVWTDATTRLIVGLAVAGGDNIYLYKHSDNNKLRTDYVSGGVTKTVLRIGVTELAFFYFGVTWSISDDEFIFYYNGVQNGAIQNGLGTWLGNLSNTETVIGAISTVPANIWSGNIGPVPTWSEALSPDEMRYLG